jgi:hypothetical protein
VLTDSFGGVDVFVYKSSQFKASQQETESRIPKLRFGSSESAMSGKIEVKAESVYH